MAKRAEFAVALGLDILAAAGALLIAGRSWQTVLTPRPRPLTDDVLRVTGHTLDAATTALGLVALAGVVAVLATRGLARRVVGGALTLAGGLIVWRSLAGLRAISSAAARDLVKAKHSGAGVDASVAPHLTLHQQWPVLSAVCGVLVAVAGMLVTIRSHRWATMSGRYEAPSARPASAEEVAVERAPKDTSMWTALDRGADPTVEPGSPDR